MLALLAEHFFFCFLRAAPFLAADFFEGLLAGAFLLKEPLFELVTELAPRIKAVHFPRTLPLAFHF